MSKPREKERKEKEKEREKEKEKEKGRGTAQVHESAYTSEATSDQGGGADSEARGPEAGGRDLKGKHCGLKLLVYAALSY